MANLYEYADSNSKTGYFLRGRSKTSNYYNLQTTPAANQLFSELPYKAGRIPHTEGDSVPGELTWRMYQAGLLETENSDSTLNTLSNDELKATFDASNDSLSLSDTALETLQTFIESYSGAGKNRVKQLESLLETDDNTTSSSNSDSITSEHTSVRVNAAGTSLSEIRNRIEEFESRDQTPCHVSVDDIVSHPSGPQSFTQFCEHPYPLESIYGTEFTDNNAFDYSLSYTTDPDEDTQFRVSDYTIHDSPTGIDDSGVGGFAAQAQTSRTDCDYAVQFFDEYDSQHTPGDEEFTLFLGENPIMTQTVLIDDGRIMSWNAEVTEHGWNRTLRLFVLDKAGLYIGVVARFFEDFDGYHLESPARDYNDLSVAFDVDELSAAQKENLRDAINHDASE